MESKNYSLRDRPSRSLRLRDVPPEFRVFAVTAILPGIKFQGYKQAEKRELAIQVVHNLVLTGLLGRCVADSRSTHDAGARLRIAVWDAVEEAGYVRKQPGSQQSGMVTRYAARRVLLDLYELWRPQLTMTDELKRNSELEHPIPHALVYGHTGKRDPASGKVLPDDEQRKPLAIPTGLTFDRFRELEDWIECINDSNLNFTWKAHRLDEDTGKTRVFYPNPLLRQVHVGNFFRAMRLYTFGSFGAQSLPKAVRRTIRIGQTAREDGEAVTELDFKAMFLRMVYHMANEEPDEGDLYHPEQVFPRFYAIRNAGPRRRALVRSFTKLATNACLNNNRRVSANRAVANIARKHPESEFLRKLLKNTEGITPAQVIDRILVTHPRAVVDQFFTDNGSWLMSLDGLVMLLTLLKFAYADKPALGIHDSLVVRRSDAEFAHDAMMSSYFGMFRKYPEIATVY